MINVIFGTGVDCDKNMLMSLEKNHPDWKEIYSITNF